MKYVCNEQYRTFHGYVFWQGKPVDVTDKATLAAIQREPGFMRIEDEEARKVEQAGQEARVLKASTLTLGRKAK